MGDDASRKALYEAVRDFGLADEGGPAEGAPEARVVMRRARPFDPSRSPAPSEPSKEEDAEAQALREKAQQGHHQLLVHLHAALQHDGWTNLEEIPAAIDLRGRSPRGEHVIFEAKTISDSNETSQCRGALAQLLEYRLDYGHPDDLVVVVVDAAVGSRRSEILERLGLAALLATADGLTSLNETGRTLLQDLPGDES